MHPTDDSHVLDIPLTQIVPDPNQPRKDFGEVSKLVRSMREIGQLQPITVTKVTDILYQIVDGESRHRAAQILEWATIQCIVVEIDDNKRRDVQFASNVHRSEFTPFELAEEYHRKIVENGITQARLAEEEEVSESTVSGILRLRDLPDEIRERLLPVSRTVGKEAIILVPRAGSIDAMHKLVDLVIKGATVARLKKALSEAKGKAAPVDKVDPSPDIVEAAKPGSEPSVDEMIITQWWSAYTVHAVRVTDLLEVLAGSLQMTSRALSSWLEENNDKIIAGHRVVSVSLAPTKVVYQLVSPEMERRPYQLDLKTRLDEHKRKATKSI